MAIVLMRGAHVTCVTSAAKNVDHLVTDQAMTAGIAAHGVFVGLCGDEFAAASMVAEPGPVCPRCATARSGLAQQRPVRHQRRSGQRWWTRVLPAMTPATPPSQVTPEPSESSALTTADDSAAPPITGPSASRPPHEQVATPTNRSAAA